MVNSARENEVSRVLRFTRYAMLAKVETVMVRLEKLWHSGVIPADWDTAAFDGSGDVVS